MPHPAAPRSLAPLLGRTLLLWLVPFLVSVPLVDASGAPRIGVVPFKAVMVAVLAVTAWWVRRHPAPDIAPSVAAVAYVAGQLVLDVAVLVLTLGVPVGVWATTIVPVYALIPVVTAWRVPRVACERP